MHVKAIVIAPATLASALAIGCDQRGPVLDIRDPIACLRPGAKVAAETAKISVSRRRCDGEHDSVSDV
ncbi:MAG: hypothetical protein ACLTSZ_18575 [Lachnospiraceae bacterium]